MSDTRRHINDHILYPSDWAEYWGIQSKKHHQKDRKGFKSKDHRFSKYVRNSKRNLVKKYQDLDFDADLEGIE